ncbi:MAG: hypothetical protein V5A46_00365 [Haloferacaceae archaeon]
MTTGVPLGLVVLVAILLMPVYVTLGAWFGGKPRDFRTAAIGAVYMGVIAALMIGATAGMGVAFWVIQSL